MAEVHLDRVRFTADERPVARAGGILVSAFRYPSGIEALRLKGPRSELVVLPYFGQQVWRAAFDGTDVTMGSMFEAPVPTDRYLDTYGAFFIHCGLAGLGAPGPGDTHPLHGELPLARYAEARLLLDPAAGRVEIWGTFHHRVAFTTNYRATARVAVTSAEPTVEIGIDVENLREAPLDLLYLGHANFRPVDGGRLDYSAPYTPAAVAVRRSVPAHITPPPGYSEFIDSLAADPALHHVLEPGLGFDPEAVFLMRMTADAAGWAHCMQTHPDGSADYMGYDTAGLPMATRWICRTADQQGLGMMMPATAGVEGYAAEKAAGRVLVVVPGKGRWSARMKAGRLDRDGADAMRRHIDRTAGRGRAGNLA